MSRPNTPTYKTQDVPEFQARVAVLNGFIALGITTTEDVG
jgi:hypothetical protein